MHIKYQSESKMIQKCHQSTMIIVFMVIVTIIVIIAASAVTKVYYVDELNHYHDTTCTAKCLSITNYGSYRTNKGRHIKYSVLYSFILQLDGKEYTKKEYKIQDTQICVNKTACYYDDRKPESTLKTNKNVHLSKTDHVAPVILLFSMSLVLFVTTVATIYVVKCKGVKASTRIIIDSDLVSCASLKVNMSSDFDSNSTSNIIDTYIDNVSATDASTDSIDMIGMDYMADMIDTSNNVDNTDDETCVLSDILI